MDIKNVEVLEKQPCAYCRTNNLALTQTKYEIPYFGEVMLFSMTCTNCKFHKADLDCIKQKGKVKYTLEITSLKDLNSRVLKSAEATVKIPRIGNIRPGIASQGYITNIEGVIKRMKRQVETLVTNAEKPEERKKAKNMVKKLQKVLWGKEKLKIIIEDPTGNSAIISEKAIKS